MVGTSLQSWEVKEVMDGTMVTLTAPESNPIALARMVDELWDLVQASQRPNLYIDFETVKMLASVVLGKLIALDKKLREGGGKLILVNLDPFLYKTFQVTRLTELLDIRPEEGVGVSS